MFQGKQKDGSPFVEYGGWYKACKVDRLGFMLSYIMFIYLLAGKVTDHLLHFL